MSEIPLHPFGRARKARAGYTALPEDEAGASQSSETDDRMPSAVVAAAVTSARPTRKPKRIEQYDGDEEEEATLLGEHGHDHEEPEDLRAETSSRVSVLFYSALS